MKSWKFSQIIINWQHQFGRNHLPWQKKRNSYYIWISEIMLQQTKVKTVIPYFQKFISVFHNIQEIANSNLNQILYLWSGLGYYKRAQYIYKTAKIIVNKYHGKLPKNIFLLMQLPGIGRTTAGAILSLTYNFSFPILDGNVKRILIRFYNINIDNKKNNITKILWKKINFLTPLHNARSFNQGMMDLGALVCNYKNPKCYLCPVKEHCKYVHQTNSDNIIKKKKIKKKYFFFILKYKNYVLLEYRKKYNIWNKLFCFPEFKTMIELQKWITENKIQTKYYQKHNNINHYFTNFTLRMIMISSVIQKKKNIKIKNSFWYNLNTLQLIGIPTPIKKILLSLKKNIGKIYENCIL